MLEAIASPELFLFEEMLKHDWSESQISAWPEKN